MVANDWAGRGREFMPPLDEGSFLWMPSLSIHASMEASLDVLGKQDVAFSNRMVDAYKEAESRGKGAALLDGKMIDIAMYRMGMDVLGKAEGIKQKIRARQEAVGDTMWIPGR